jgi:hypothetical protein
VIFRRAVSHFGILREVSLNARVHVETEPCYLSQRLVVVCVGDCKIIELLVLDQQFYH